MSYCKFCGAEIEEGKTCTCHDAVETAAIKAKAQEIGEIFRQVQEGSASRSQQPEEDEESMANQAAEAEEKQQEETAETSETENDQADSEETKVVEEIPGELNPIIDEEESPEEKTRRIVVQAAAEHAAAEEEARQASIKASADYAAAKAALDEASRQAETLAMAQENAHQVAVQSAATQAVAQAEEAIRLATQAAAAAKAAEEAAEQARKRSQRSKKGVIEIGPLGQGLKDLVNVFIRPGKGIGNYVVSDSMWASLIAICLHSALNGLMAMFIFNSVNNLLSSAVNSVSSSIADLFGKGIGDGVSVNLFHGSTIFSLTFAYSVVMQLVFSLIVFIVAKIAREDKINIIRSLNAAAARAMLGMPIIAVCVGITYLFAPLGFILFGFFSYLILIISLCHIFDECDKVHPNLKVYSVIIIFIVYRILFMIFLAICWKSYIPTSISGPMELVNDIVGMFK